MKKLSMLILIVLGLKNSNAQWTTSGNNIYNSNSGNVGIGTTTPGSKLTINGNIEGNGNAYLTSATSSFQFSNQGADRDGLFYISSLDRLDVKRAFNTTVTFLNNGNVGIGTSSPAAKLHVNSTILAEYTGATTDAPNLRLYNGSAATNTPGEYRADLYIHNSTGQLTFRNVTGKGYNFINAAAGSSLLNVLDNGNVGIGTTDPSCILHIAQNDGAADAVRAPIILSRYWSNSSDTRATALFNYYNSSNNNDQLVFAVSGSGGSTGTPLNYSQAKMVIQGNGNVGIGTTTPTRQLDVIGSPIFQSNNINASIRMKPFSASYNGGNQVVDFSENFDIGNSAIGVIGLANTTWAAPLPSFALVSTKNGSGSAKDMMFWANDNPSNSNVALTIKANTGNVCIGTTAPGPYKLAVEGTIGARKVKVTQVNPWADYVFNNDYPLLPLNKLEKYIQQNKHLPDVPSATEVEKSGLDLGENQAVLLKKVEELTLYIIEQNKKIEKLETQNKEMLDMKKDLEIIKASLQIKN